MPNTTDNANQAAANDFTPPAISLPKGGGAIRGIGEKFAANPVTGTGSMTVPIATSPGRSGFGPQLALSYDSGEGNGPFGLGWNLSLPTITRKTDKGIPTYQDDEESDTFILSGSEDLVPVLVEECGAWRRKPFVRSVDGVDYKIQRYRPRIEGLFARIERWVNLQSRETHWRSITRDNITTLYGKTAESRIVDPADSGRIFSWLICESYDDKGNAIRYEYSPEDSKGVGSTAHERNRTDESRSANRYIKRINYGNLPSRLVEPDLSKMHWLFEVVFDYGEGHYELLPVDKQGRQFVQAVKDETAEWATRQDPFSSYRAGFEVRTYRLCQRVLMFHHFPEELGTDDYLVRSTEFDYRQSPIASFITAVTQSGYVRRPDETYLKKSLPAIEYEYSEAIIDDRIREIDAASLENLPYGLDGTHYRWVDLDGEGISGILTEQGNTWFYKENLGGGRFGALQIVASKPSLAALGSGPQQLLDLAGDGQLDLVQLSSLSPGFYERTEDQLWEPFTPFASLPNISFDDPNLRFIDLTGDGHADVLITEHEALTWYPSLAEEGFGRAEKVRQALEEESGPRAIFNDNTQSIFLADMSGDGLSDIVRVRNGEVCYWPSLGYGRFGAKVTMDRAPVFDMTDLFDQRRVQLADIDGSGVSDIIYLAHDGIQLYFNQSGNGWSEQRSLPQFPRTDNLSLVTVVDLLGNGTACVVWSSTLPGYARRPMRYIDLMGGQKPHLMVGMKNNMGAETRLQYAPSTRFYIEDKLNGKPWITKLPFPVHVVERAETLDHINRNRFVTRYAYHHGYFDGVEREFRGFGMVEQQDTEEFAALNANASLSDAANIDEASHVPPVLTKTWFHLGFCSEGDRVSRHFEEEYYREPGLSKAEFSAQLLSDTILPSHLNAQQQREACRALKGSILRQETYALDGLPKSVHPYVVSERNYTIKPLQPVAENRFAVFLTRPRETIDYHYERNPSDPRIGHALTLEVDAFGNVLRSAAIAYGRRSPDSSLAKQDQEKQAQTLLTYTENRFTGAVELEDDYRVPLPCESRTFELTGLTIDSGKRFDFSVVDEAVMNAAEIAYEAKASGGLQKRLLQHARTLYRRNDFTDLLPLGQLESLALPGESCQQAFTPGLLSQVYGDRVTEEMLLNEGGYVHSEGDDNWWIPSGHVFFSPDAPVAPSDELDAARQHFFLPRRFLDPFGNATVVSYDDRGLLPTETRDALGNSVRSENDYRVMQSRLLIDLNLNRTAVAFDALGLVVGTALMGKEGESLGDSLDGFDSDLDEATIIAHVQDPFDSPHDILKRASNRMVYDLHLYQRTSATDNPQPNVVYTLARETHDADLAPGEQTAIQHSFSYSNGFGSQIQKKIQAEAGPVPRRNDDGRISVNRYGQLEMTSDEVSPRWIGSGWTILNNKGKPVRQFESFFTDTHRFESEVLMGVGPIFFYDPAERVVATLYPNHSWEKVIFDSWKQETWDTSDTALVLDPKTDADVGAFFSRLADDDYLPTWYALRTQPDQELAASQRWADPQSRDAEKRAAEKVSVYAETPSTAHADSLGRTFVAVSYNRFKYSDAPPESSPVEEFQLTRTILDIEGNQCEVIDARDRVIMRYKYDMLGKRIHQASMDAGERLILNDVSGKALYAWDSRNYQFRMAYDALLRPTDSYLREGAGDEMVIGRSIYGESSPDPAARNLLGRIVQLFDQAGVVTTNEYDFKGNLLHSQRQLAQEYRTTLDWSTTVPLETETYTGRTRYDALNRTIQVIAPHSDREGATVNVIEPIYNEANLLEQIHAWLNQSEEPTGWLAPATADLHAVNNINYNAKGQRELIEYGNGVTTKYDYEPETFRLTRLKTASADHIALQDLSYTYDLAGNVSHLYDYSQQDIYFRNKCVEPSADYAYDATYRLIEASGREHLGQPGGAPVPHSYNDIPRVGIDWSANDGNAVGTYLERYVYDVVGNLREMQHRGADPAHPGWTRTYSYSEPSLLEPGKQSNRLGSTTIGANNQTTEQYGYDSHGNMTRMPHLQVMQWDFKNQLQLTQRQAVNDADEDGVQHNGERTYYVYDSAGQRSRKVTELGAGQIKDERIYFGTFEIYRKRSAAALLMRETLHVMDDKQRIALVETRTQGDEPGVARQLIRYQIVNRLGSSCLELNDRAEIISYEEYTPYGSTTYQTVRNNTAMPKRYRYMGKERDEESGLYYIGARFYAPWLARWTSCDPAGIDADPILYSYARNRPLYLVDPTGKWPEFLDDALGEAKDAVLGITSSAHAVIEGGIWNPTVAGTITRTERFVIDTARGKILEKFLGNIKGLPGALNQAKDADRALSTVVQQIKTTYVSNVERVVVKATNQATRFIANNVPHAGKEAQAVLNLSTGTSPSVIARAENAVAAVPGSVASPKVTVGLPGPVGTLLKFLAPVGAILSASSLQDSIAKGDIVGTLTDASGFVAGSMETGALALSYFGGSAGTATSGTALIGSGGVAGAGLSTGAAVIGSFAVGLGIGRLLDWGTGEWMNSTGISDAVDSYRGISRPEGQHGDYSLSGMGGGVITALDQANTETLRNLGILPKSRPAYTQTVGWWLADHLPSWMQ